MCWHRICELVAAGQTCIKLLKPQCMGRHGAWSLEALLLTQDSIICQCCCLTIILVIYLHDMSVFNIILLSINVDNWHTSNYLMCYRPLPCSEALACSLPSTHSQSEPPGRLDRGTWGRFLRWTPQQPQDPLHRHKLHQPCPAEQAYDSSQAEPVNNDYETEGD